MVSFSQLPAVKKDIIVGAARKKFVPFYFVTALAEFPNGILILDCAVYTPGPRIMRILGLEKVALTVNSFSANI